MVIPPTRLRLLPRLVSPLLIVACSVPALSGCGGGETSQPGSISVKGGSEALSKDLFPTPENSKKDVSGGAGTAAQPKKR